MASSSSDALKLGSKDRQECANKESIIFNSAAEPSLVSLFEHRLHQDRDLTSSQDPKAPKLSKDKKKPEDPTPSLQDLQREVHHNLTMGPDKSQALQSVQDIAAQVVKAMFVLNSPKIEGQAIRISLNNLGLLDGVRVDIQLHKQSLNIAFFAQEALAYDFLKKNLPELKKTLEAKNLQSIESIQIACHTEIEEELVDAYNAIEDGFPLHKRV